MRCLWATTARTPLRYCRSSALIGRAEHDAQCHFEDLLVFCRVIRVTTRRTRQQATRSRLSQRRQTTRCR
jgi:hypothetical protein